MKVKVITFALAALLLAAAAPAQNPSQGSTANPSSAAPAPNKVGILNVRLAIVSTAEGKVASAELQSQFAPRQNELSSMGKQLQDLQSRLNTGGQTMADEERSRLQRQGEALQKAYNRKSEELREDVQAAEAEVYDRISRKMSPVVDRYGEENGFAVIFDVTGGVVHAAASADITQDIIRLYDQANPVKAAAPAARPQTQPGQTKPPAPKPPQQ